MNITALANWNGEEMALGDVKVSVLDRGFLFGDAVYEVVRIYRGQLFHLQDHLDRMRKSLAVMRIATVNNEILSQRLEQIVTASQVVDGLAYVQITRGEAPRAHRYPDHAVPNVLMYVDQFNDPYADSRGAGVSAVTHPDIRWGRNDIKATSLAANCMAAQYAHERGCADVIFVDFDGTVTEGSHTSIFGVRQGMIIVAPASPHVLPGITKKLIVELADSSGIQLCPEYIKQSDLHGLDELFLAGTPEEILAIVQVDDRPIGGGVPGPVVKKLQFQFRQLVEDWCAHSPANSTPR